MSLCMICKAGSMNDPMPDFVCGECRANAKLGRVVRAMPPNHHLISGGGRWWVDNLGDIMAGEGDTPEEALEKAGIK